MIYSHWLRELTTLLLVVTAHILESQPDMVYRLSESDSYLDLRISLVVLLRDPIWHIQYIPLVYQTWTLQTPMFRAKEGRRVGI